MRETALKGADCGFGSLRKECGGRTSAAITGSRARCGASVWSGAVCSGPLWLHSGGGTALGSSSSSISIRLLAVTLFLTASELELAHCFTRRRPKLERACAAAAVRSCVRRGLPSCSWRLATLLKCHAVSRTAYIFPEGQSLPAADW